MMDTHFYLSTKLLGFIVTETQYYKNFQFKGFQHVLFIVTTLKIEESKECGTCNYSPLGK